MHLSDSLSNPGARLLRLVTALDELGSLENMEVSGDTHEIVAQSGAVDPGAVRLQVKENRKLSHAEVVELVDAYKAGVSQRELTRRFGLHEQTVRAHLRRQEVAFRSQRVLADAQEAEAARLYVEETWLLAEVAACFGVGQTAIRNLLVRRRGGVWRGGLKRSGSGLNSCASC